MPSNLTSRIEALHNELVYLFEQISVANGYRTDPAEVTKGYIIPTVTTEFPTISVVLGDRRIFHKDGNRVVFNVEVDVDVIGYIQATTSTEKGEGKLMADSGDPLLHDLIQCMMGFMLTSVNATNRWIVSGIRPITAKPFNGSGQNKGWVALTFTAMILFTTTGVQ